MDTRKIYPVDDSLVTALPVDENKLALQEFLVWMGISARIGEEPMDRPEVVFDMVLDDGQRYVLTRLPRHTVSLSQREWEIVRLIAQGLPNKGIAQVLEISQFTVATHLRRIFGKLNVNSRAEMMARAMELNLFQKMD